MRLTAYLIAVTFVGTLSATPAVATEEGEASFCANIEIDTASGFSSDRELICKAAHSARVFFQSHGITNKRRIRIRLHQDELNNHANHIGLYDARKDHIEMVTLEHARYHCNEQPPFDVQMDRELYQSFVVHEVAHAIASQSFSHNIIPSSIVVQEYLAYVTQFSTMDEDARSKILQKYKVTPFTGIEDMSLTYYQLDPNAFGVKAFRHYQSLANKSGFIQGLLSGDIKPGLNQMDWW